MRGHLDRLDHGLNGWVVDAARPAALLDLTLLVDGIPPARGPANQPRPDVAAVGLGGPACGFALVLPAECLNGAEHVLALQVPGRPPFQRPGLPARVVLGLPCFCVTPAVPEMLDAILALLRQTHVESALDPAWWNLLWCGAGWARRPTLTDGC